MNKKVESGAVTEDDFIAAFAQITEIKVNTGKEMNETLAAIRVGLTSKLWEKRVEQLRRLRGVIKGVSDAGRLMSIVRAIENELGQCVGDLRSQVVREACLVVGYLSVRMGAALEPAVEPLAASLVGLVPNGARVMASCGRTALAIVYKHTQSRRLLTTLCYTLTSSRSTPIRQFYCELLHLMCSHWQSKKVESLAAVFCEALRSGIGDADGEARKHARRAFVAFYTRFEKHADKLLLSLDPGKRAQLKKELQKSEEDRSDASSSFSSSTASKNATMVSIDVSREAIISQSNMEIATPRHDPRPDTSLEQILLQMTSDLPGDRKLAMVHLQAHIATSPLLQPQVRAVVDALSLSFIEHDQEVLATFLEVLSTFLDSYLDEECPWLQSLLLNLVLLRSCPRRRDIMPKVDVVLALVASRVPTGLLRECGQLLMREGASLPAEARLGLCRLLAGVLGSGTVPMSSKGLLAASGSLTGLEGLLSDWAGDSRQPLLVETATNILRSLHQSGPEPLQRAVSVLSSQTRRRVSARLGMRDSPSRIPISPSMMRLAPTTPPRPVLASRDLNLPPQPVPTPSGKGTASLLMAMSALASALTRDPHSDQAGSVLRRLITETHQDGLTPSVIAGLCASLSQAIDHSICSVRKHAILTLVALHDLEGDAIWLSLPLTPCQRALFDVYKNKPRQRPARHRG